MGRQLKEPSLEQWKRSIMDDISGPPSLQRIASLAIAIKLWTDIPKKEFPINAVQMEQKERLYRTLEEKIFIKLTALSLPKPSEIEVIHVIRPIGLQLFRLYLCDSTDKRFLNFIDHFENNKQLCWTVNGAIDKVTTCNKLINEKISTFNRLNDDQCPNADIIILFKLASNLCMKEQTHSLWSKFSIYNAVNLLNYLHDFSEDYKCHLCLFWFTTITGRTDIFESVINTHYLYDRNKSQNENMLELSTELRNPIAFKYFWSNLTYEEKNNNSMKFFLSLYDLKYYHFHLFFEYQSHDELYDITSFLFLQLDLLKQKKVLKRHTLFISKTFFYYFPHQKYFLPLVSVIDKFSAASKSIFMDFADLVENTKVSEIKRKLLKQLLNLCRNASKDLKLCIDKFLEDYVLRKLNNVKEKFCFGQESEEQMDDSEERMDDSEEEMDDSEEEMDDSEEEMDDSEEEIGGGYSEGEMDSDTDSVCKRYISQYNKIFNLENEAICVLINAVTESDRKKFFVFITILCELYNDKNHFNFDQVDAFLSKIQLSNCEIKDLKKRVWKGVQEERENLLRSSRFSGKNSREDDLFCWCFSMKKKNSRFPGEA